MNESIDFVEYESRSVLDEHLRQFNDCILIGHDSEAPRNFYTVRLPQGGPQCQIAVISSGFGVEPSAWLPTGTSVLILGHDSFVTGIDLVSKIVIFSIKLNGLFYSFLATIDEDSPIIIHELGTLRINLSGHALWQVNTDIVEDFERINSQLIILRVIDFEGRIAIDIDSGATTRLACS